jgi:hypothetical protein
MIAPMLVPAMDMGFMFFDSNSRMTPICASPLAPHHPSASQKVLVEIEFIFMRVKVMGSEYNIKITINHLFRSQCSMKSNSIVQGFIE